MRSAFRPAAALVARPVRFDQQDESAPLADAVDTFNKLETTHKHMEIIPGAGHNDLMSLC